MSSAGTLALAQTDLAVGGLGPAAAVVRGHGPGSGWVGPFGPGWFLGLYAWVSAYADGRVLYVDGDGTKHWFGPDGAGGYRAPTGL